MPKVKTLISMDRDVKKEAQRLCAKYNLTLSRVIDVLLRKFNTVGEWDKEHDQTNSG